MKGNDFVITSDKQKLARRNKTAVVEVIEAEFVVAEEIPPSAVPPSAAKVGGGPTPPTPHSQTPPPSKWRQFIPHAGWGLAFALVIVVVLLSLSDNRQREVPPPSGPPSVSVSNDASPTACNHRVIETSKEWTDEIIFPRGRVINWMPRSAVTYEIMTADGKKVSFPAATQEPIAVRAPLAPWFKFRAVDADKVVIDVYCK